METRPFLVNGEWRTGEGTFEVTSPYDDSVVAEIGVPTAADVEEATAVAAETFETSQHLPVHVRSEALEKVNTSLRSAAVISFLGFCACGFIVGAFISFSQVPWTVRGYPVLGLLGTAAAAALFNSS